MPIDDHAHKTHKGGAKGRWWVAHDVPESEQEQEHSICSDCGGHDGHERHLVEARSAAGPICRSRSGGVADLVGHRGRNGEEEASEGAGSPLKKCLEEPSSGI